MRDEPPALIQIWMWAFTTPKIRHPISKRFAAFSVVLGTLAIQGLTLKPLLRALDLHDDDPVRRELSAARERALRAGLASFARDRSPIAEVVRQEFTARLAYERPDADADDDTHSAHGEIYREALQAARQAVLAMRARCSFDA
jgi:CPA1 family monovalent cation:H+ antiporter